MANKSKKNEAGRFDTEAVPVRKALNVVRKWEGNMLWLGVDLSQDYGLTGGDNTRIASTLGNKRLDDSDEPNLRFQVNVFRLVPKGV